MPLEVLLAGYNVDAEVLANTRRISDLIQREIDPNIVQRMNGEELRSLMAELQRIADESCTSHPLTPEVLSAAYARISRDPKPVPELRRAARESVAGARKSNEAIIFGLGHASVAEHAVFNIDILGLSRLATEEVQSHRLLSFTEKSQRYVTASTDYVLPEEIKGMAWEERFHTEIQSLFAAYHHFFKILHQRIIEREGEGHDALARREQENRAKEDARYLLPLATTTQMGVTVNARTLEYILRKFHGHNLAEMQLLGEKLCKVVRPLAPSLLKYVHADSHPSSSDPLMEETHSSKPCSEELRFFSGPEVHLTHSTPQGEQIVAETIAFRRGIQLDPRENSIDFWRDILRKMKSHDAAPREFELATMQFQAKISASCFAQLKRHRMMTLVPAPHTATDGAVIPPAVVEAELSEEFQNRVRHISTVCEELSKDIPIAAPYLLANSHMRHVILQVNARELYHMSRLRQDEHAQWEIRQLASQMTNEARRLWPNMMALACGKHEFDETYKRLLGGKC
jgi:flavin-dependent thymidylate synthase